MAAIPSTYVDGDEPTAAQWNSPGLALKSLGLSDDNGGRVQFPGSINLPVALQGALAGVSTRVVTPAAAFTVPPSTLAILRGWGFDATLGQILYAPAGGSATLLVGYVGTPFAPTPANVVFGAGDTISVTGAATTPASGAILQLLPQPANCSRFLFNVAMEPTAHYIVPGNGALLITAFLGTGTVITAYIDDNAVAVPPFGNYATGGLGYPAPILLAAGQKLECSVATVVNGLLFTV